MTATEQAREMGRAWERLANHHAARCGAGSWSGKSRTHRFSWRACPELTEEDIGLIHKIWLQ